MIIENSNFKIGEIPHFHPISQKYDRLQFWREQKRRCIEGYWSGGKWMPPELYYYTNFHNILFEEGIYRSIGLPWLRDIDWEKAYVYSEATGFSGFTGDSEYSCNRMLITPGLTDYDFARMYKDLAGRVIDEYKSNFYKKDGTLKKYIPARDYLRKNHGHDMGKALYLNQSQHVIEVSSRGYGKEVPDYQLVETINGKVRIDSLSIGDKVLGRDGKETSITAIYPQGEKDIYEFTFEDGRVIECGLDHQWYMHRASGKYGVFTTKQILDIGIRNKNNKKTDKIGGFKFFLPNIDQVEYPKRNLPIDPYILGCLIGDGTITNSTPKIASDDEEILNEFRARLKDFILKKDEHTPNNYTISYHGADKYLGKHKCGHNPLYRKIVDLGLNKTCYTKFIPEEYKYSSIKQRMELVRGLMDTDGSINTDGSIEFMSSSEQLVNDLAYVLRSLGIRCSIGVENRPGRVHMMPQGKESTTTHLIYRLYIRTNKPIFKLTRKLSRLKSKLNRQNVPLVKIEKKGTTSQRCITVDNKDHLFLLENFVPTHNSVTASGQISHNFLFDGARDYDMYLKRREDDNPLQSETVLGAVDAKYSIKLMDKVKMAIDRLPGKEVITINGEKMEYPSPLSIGYSGSFAVGKQGVTTDVSKTILQHVTFNDNPLAANGGRPNRIFIDEVGFASNILEIWEAIESTQASADFKRLTIYGMGTGGLTAGGAVAYIQEMFYNPESYGCLAFDDEWENRGKISYFISGVQALNKFKEGPNLITNEARALDYITKEREVAEKSRSQTKILGTIINKPIKPSEIFLRMEGNFFQTQELKNHLSNIESKKSLLDSSWKVDLRMEKEGLVEAIPSNKKVIRDFPLTRNTELDACVEMFERPKKNNNGVVPSSRYYIVVDPVDDDGNDNFKRSLQSTHVFDSWTNRFVAEYTARTYLAEDYYEVVRRLSIYYNASILYENNKKGLYTYFKNKNSLYRLLPTPEILKEQFSTKIEGIDTNKGLGINMSNVRLKLHAVRLFKTYLDSPSYEDTDVKNLYTIKSVAFLKELISFSMDINADRVSAALVLMILLSDIGDKTVKAKESSVKTASSNSFWGNAYRSNNKVYNPLRIINQQN